MSTQAYSYDAEGRDREIALDEIAVDKLDAENLLWIDIDDRDPSTLEDIRTLLDLRSDVWTADHPARPQLEDYGEQDKAETLIGLLTGQAHRLAA